MVKNKKIIPLIIFLSIALGFFLGRTVYKSENIFYAQNKDFRNLKMLIQIVEQNYADELNVFDYLKDALLVKLQTIDPYISFYEADDYNNIKNKINGNYTGIGIKYFVYNDTILISEVFKNSPANKSGLKKLDRIIAINNNDITGLPIDSVGNIFSDKEKMQLTVLSYYSNKKHKIDIKKNTVQINPVKYFYIGKNTAYIKIESFHSNTYEFLKKAGKNLLTKHKIDNLILDLRDNPGGLLSSAIDVLDEFFQAGDTLAVTETKKGEKETFISSADGMFKNTKIIVLINGTTASAAELVSLALQDNDRALFIGTNTYGKGVFQQDMPVVKGSVVHITKGKYYGPSGRWVDMKNDNFLNYKFYETKKGRYVADKNGITPDINLTCKKSYIDGLFDEYCLKFIFKDKKTFQNVKSINKILNISESIVDTGGVKIYDEYFDNDSIKIKILAHSFAKYLLPESNYLHFISKSDTCFIRAFELIKNSDINEEILKNDTLYPYPHLINY